MEMLDNHTNVIKGAEAIVIHNGNIVLGMQNPKRWYKLANEKSATIIKTLGGQIEKEDKDSSLRALIREALEELKGIEEKNLRATPNPVCTIRIRMGDLNVFESDSDLMMEADFYLLQITGIKYIEPNDLPAIFEIPIKDFLKLELRTEKNLETMRKYIIKNKTFQSELPEYYSLLIPDEVMEICKYIKEMEFER